MDTFSRCHRVATDVFNEKSIMLAIKLFSEINVTLKTLATALTNV
jgi:hypothetical protein